ncbi:hypothetical protein [Streptomyces olivoreticuli]|uniref:hypothetical protein n=1 Tax=Streptomyces olivoreticuli TaxID=68246 RepID=UPI000E221F03|nr:hypothetical protein [Streptomyces olivoreticuli]
MLPPLAPDEKSAVDDIDHRSVLNTHLEWTPEFVLRLSDGRTGQAAAPRAETPSMYEEQVPRPAGDSDQVAAEARAAFVGRAFDQESFDDELSRRRSRWGHAACYALSAAFFEASLHRFRGSTGGRKACPRLLFNLLNGGLHAYSLPVTSDFTEFLLVPRGIDTVRAIDGYRRLLREARTAVARLPLRAVGGNPVHDLGPDPNAQALSLVSTLLERVGLAEAFGIMIDASAGDWFDETGRYVLPVSGRRFDRDGLVDYWLDLLIRFDVVMLEDPLAETDMDGWSALHDARPSGCRLLGDNFTSTCSTQLAAKARHVDGVLLKPDQIGLMSGVYQFASLARDHGLPLIASARSVETDNPLISHVATELCLDYLKAGPYQDFSSVMRSNELLRAGAA